MKKIISGVFGILLIVGCAGQALKKDWETKRGYSKEDVQTIMDQSQDYKKRLISGGLGSNAFNSTPEQAEENKLRTIWCNCYKRLKDKCRQKSDGLSTDEKSIWLKANAVEMAFASRETSLDAKPNTKLDGDECP